MRMLVGIEACESYVERLGKMPLSIAGGKIRGLALKKQSIVSIRHGTPQAGDRLAICAACSTGRSCAACFVLARGSHRGLSSNDSGTVTARSGDGKPSWLENDLIFIWNNAIVVMFPFGGL